MTHELALKLRNALAAVFELNADDYYHVSIKPYLYDDSDDRWCVYLFANSDYSSFLAELTVLGHGIECCTDCIRLTFDDLDIGTTTPEMRRAIRLK